MSVIFYSADEMRALSDSDVISYASQLMQRKVELAQGAIGRNGDDSKKDLEEANQIGEQLRQLAAARKIKVD